MSEKRYFWLKLKEDFFDDKQIKYLRSLPDGDKVVITYLKMQLKSLKADGIIRYDKLLPSSEEELSMMLDEDINIIKLTLKALEQINAIEILADESIYMIALQELVGSEGASSERVRKFRERQKALQSNNDVTNVTLLRYGEIEIDKELDKEKELDAELEKEIRKILGICKDNGIELSTNAKNFIYESLIQKDLTADLTMYAISEAIDHQIKNWCYIQKILNRYKFEDYKTIDEVKQDTAERNNLGKYNKKFMNQFYSN